MRVRDVEHQRIRRILFTSASPRNLRTPSHMLPFPKPGRQSPLGYAYFHLFLKLVFGGKAPPGPLSK